MVFKNVLKQISKNVCTMVVLNKLLIQLSTVVSIEVFEELMVR
jgi:hypothetical protein